MLIEKIAYVRNRDRNDLASEIEAEGDLKIDSKVGQAVVAYVEMEIDREGLVRPEDQNKQTLTTLNALEALIERRLDETKGEIHG